MVPAKGSPLSPHKYLHWYVLRQAPTSNITFGTITFILFLHLSKPSRNPKRWKPNQLSIEYEFNLVKGLYVYFFGRPACSENDVQQQFHILNIRTYRIEPYVHIQWFPINNIFSVRMRPPSLNIVPGMETAFTPVNCTWNNLRENGRYLTLISHKSMYDHPNYGQGGMYKERDLARGFLVYKWNMEQVSEDMYAYGTYHTAA